MAMVYVPGLVGAAGATSESSVEIGPGIGAFIVFMILAVALVLLMFNMSRHMRRIQLRKTEDEARAQLARRAAGEVDDADVDSAGESADEGPGQRGPGASSGD